MRCDHNLDILEFIDESLPESRLGELRHHLEDCHECSTLYREQVELNDLLRTVNQHPLSPPDHIWSRIEAQIGEMALEKEFTKGAGETLLDRFVNLFRIPQLGYGFAAGLLLTITGIVTVQTQQTSQVVNQTLAELDRFSIEAPAGQNPFLIEEGNGNPFFEVSEDGEQNPFRVGGAKK